jgi:hypothetical protein
VKPGDIVKYHAGLDAESAEAGFEERIVFELIVAQVLDENSLLVETGLNQEVLIPSKIEIWRYLDDRLVEIRRQLMRYVLRRLPPLGWQPSPDAQALEQIVVQINQWLRQTEPEVDWQVDPLLESLAPALRDNKDLQPFISAEGLGASFFQPYDGRLLQEAVWTRDISRRAAGSSFEKLARAEALFDWVVRNIQLVADGDRAPERPWQTLLYGRGTAAQRAWIFALLARQQGLDVVVLGVPGEETGQNDAAAPGAVSFWLPALVDEGELYLFDPRLGLPIPSPDGQGVATLSQVRADDSLLRRLDLDKAQYPMSSDRLQNVVAMVVADPFDLTRRVRQVEKRLTGDDQLALSVHAAKLAEQLQHVTGISEVRLWDFPFLTLAEQLSLGRSARLAAAIKFEPFAWRPILWKARTRQFQGRKQVADQTENTHEDELIDDHREATRLYMDKSIRPTDRDIATSSDEEARIRRTAKLDATYWQGVMSLDDGKHEVAAHWLSRPELTAEDSPWRSGAQYNLARTFEAQGKLAEAAALLESIDSPQQHGNRLRAARLRLRAQENENR